MKYKYTMYFNVDINMIVDTLILENARIWFSQLQG